ncbi:Uma2 family endonuclease [Streptomyces sp. NPDC060188]|uniref:Uma2 family endonuclease n=1 Tax=Streptomyces sp. NPDC060188 TaxID=3347068 RepID=UPI003661D477
MTALPDWMRPPRAEGWFAEDLDRLPEAPRHTQLIDGALVFVVSPPRWWLGHLVTMLTVALMEQAPADVRVAREMTIKLDQRNRPEPDLLVTTADFDGNRTWFAPDEVRLAVEVVSPESVHRDRTVKKRNSTTTTLTCGYTGASQHHPSTGFTAKYKKIRAHQDYASTPAPAYRPHSAPDAVIVSVLDLWP